MNDLYRGVPMLNLQGIRIMMVQLSGFYYRGFGFGA